MITRELINPKSIVVVGGSNNLASPGGRVLKNILDGGYRGNLCVVNPKGETVQGLQSYRAPAELPNMECAIVAVAARFVNDAVATLVSEKGAKAVIVISAGFGELGAEGKQLERDLAALCTSKGASLVGPNCIGVRTPHYNGVFAGPTPRLDPKGCDFASSSGATAVFIIEKGMQLGVSFSSLFSVGNSAQLGVEEILEYWDETFDPATSSRVKLIYLENVANPQKLLRHASSLVKKGCRIAAIKSGHSEAGSRAASSHTGALASSDRAVSALFKKAGIIRCHGREELAYTAAILQHPELRGKRVAIVTHAGGPGVMLTDTLAGGGLEVPALEGAAADALLKELFAGSSVKNPIDFLANGTLEHLSTIIDTVERDFELIDGMAVIFGDPGLFRVRPIFDFLHERMATCSKPIFPILPSITSGRADIEAFKALGRAFFDDEVAFGKALCNVQQGRRTEASVERLDPTVNHKGIRAVIDAAGDGYLAPEAITRLLDAAGIPRAPEVTTATADGAIAAASLLGFPLVMKVVGPVHKSDVGGVAMNVGSNGEVSQQFARLMAIPGAKAVLMQPMLSGTELFVGAKREGAFGHLVLVGLGGIFIEVFKDTSAALVPVGATEAQQMIRDLKGYKILQGVRGKPGVNQDLSRTSSSGSQSSSSARPRSLRWI